MAFEHTLGVGGGGWEKEGPTGRCGGVFFQTSL